MKTDFILSASLFALLLAGANPTRAALITAVPGPDDQGGMLMPMITLQATSGTGAAPTAGALHVAFDTSTTPIMKSLQQWSPGDWFAESAAWRADLGSAAGEGGTPAASAGAGDRFSNQYGFMFMSMNSPMMAAIPQGKSLAIRLVSISSELLQSYNYGGAADRWDEVFASVGDQVLWNGSMWHNYFTLPAAAEPGTYTAGFEIFLADASFTGGTGFVQYDTSALGAVADPNFTPAFVNYTWTVAAAVPEPASAAWLFGAAVFATSATHRRRRVIA